MPTLKDELKDFIGKKRRFLLFRIAEVETNIAMSMCQIPQGTYNSWTAADTKFHQVYARLDELTGLYKQEAIQLLRRDNQLGAVLLEERIIQKMKEEVENGDYNLIRTNLARDVYSRLLDNLDAPATGDTNNLTWQQRIQNIYTAGAIPPGVIPAPQGGTIIEVVQTEPVQPEQLTQGTAIEQPQPESPEPAAEGNEEGAVA